MAHTVKDYLEMLQVGLLSEKETIGCLQKLGFSKGGATKYIYLATRPKKR
ncbi:MAG: hypothetical protein RBR50_00985 [Candidatus Izemoplasmatales bacterium]|nr:hypothetical protein [Candidatus Izemoplasmatales bacterium]